MNDNDIIICWYFLHISQDNSFQGLVGEGEGALYNK